MVCIECGSKLSNIGGLHKTKKIVGWCGKCMDYCEDTLSDNSKIRKKED